MRSVTFTEKEFSSLPGQINSFIESKCKEKVMFQLGGIEADGSDIEQFMDKFHLPFHFRPMTGAIPNRNFVFGKPNPAFTIATPKGKYVLCSSVDYSLFTIDFALVDLRVDSSFPNLFLEKLALDLFKKELLASANIFFDDGLAKVSFKGVPIFINPTDDETKRFVPDQDSSIDKVVDYIMKYE